MAELEKSGPGKKLFGSSILITRKRFTEIFCRELGVKGEFKKIF